MKLIHSKFLLLTFCIAHTPSVMAGEMRDIGGDISVAVMVCSIILLFALLMLRRSQRELALKTFAFKKSEKHIMFMGDQLPSVIIFQLVYTPDEGFHFNYLSKGLELSMNIDREQILEEAQTALDYIYEADAVILRKFFDAGMEHLNPADLEIRILDLMGNLRWVRINAVPHREYGGLVWDGFVQDISERKNIEDELNDEKLNFEQLFENIEDILLVCDLNGQLLHSNPVARQELGYDEGEFEDMSIYELYPENLRNQIFEVMAKMQTSQSLACSLPMMRKNKQTKAAEMNFFKGRWKTDEVIFGVARDVETRRKTEAALQESQQMLALIMDTIPMPVFWVNEDSVYLGCNRAFMRECGVAGTEEIIGKTPNDVFNPDTANMQIASDQHVMNSNKAIYNKLEAHTCSDGSVGWRETSKIPLQNDEGHAVGVLGVWRDVTEQNRAEDRLKRTLEDMERFNHLMRGRERRTLQLKADINQLLCELGRPNKYKTTADAKS